MERLEAKGLALLFVETDGLHLGDDPQVNVTLWSYVVIERPRPFTA